MWKYIKNVKFPEDILNVIMADFAWYQMNNGKLVMTHSSQQIGS
jgi:hypothetical protein